MWPGTPAHEFRDCGLADGVVDSQDGLTGFVRGVAPQNLDGLCFGQFRTRGAPAAALFSCRREMCQAQRQAARDPKESCWRFPVQVPQHLAHASWLMGSIRIHHERYRDTASSMACPDGVPVFVMKMALHPGADHFGALSSQRSMRLDARFRAETHVWSGPGWPPEFLLALDADQRAGPFTIKPVVCFDMAVRAQQPKILRVDLDLGPRGMATTAGPVLLGRRVDVVEVEGTRNFGVTAVLTRSTELSD